MRRFLSAAVAAAAILSFTTAEAAEKSYVNDELASDALRLDASVKARPRLTADPAQMIREADAAMAAKNTALVEEISARVVAVQPKNWDAWQRWAVALAALEPADWQARYQARRNAHAAAYQAYRLAPGPREEATALTTLAATWVRSDDPRLAIDAVRRAVRISQVPQAVALYDRLRPEYGFKVDEYKIDNDAASPRVCFTFTEDLKVKVDYTPFVAVSGLANPAISVEPRQLCVDGLEHGRRYGVVLRQGLPSTVGEDLTSALDYDIYVRDRSPQVRFTGRNYVLPSTGQEGLPVVSVNTPSVDVTVHRIGDRSLGTAIREETFLGSLDGSQVRKLTEEKGRQVWAGSLAIKTELNRDVVTAFPVTEAIGRVEPGLYVMTARLPGPKTVDAEGEDSSDWENRATQWFVVSDLGLTAFSGEEGLVAIARSLGSARPVPGISLRLLARNNDVLATATTDADGRANFEAGLTRGTGGMAPGVIVAEDGKGDYGFLDLARDPFDLTDRGVAGRLPPKGLDAFVSTERGVYRTGETVNVTTLLRDARGLAVAGVPLTLVVQRPDGVEHRRVSVADQGDGGRVWSLPLISGLQTGTWRIRVFADPKRPPIGETTFLVADYLPERIDVTLTPAKPVLAAGEPAVIDVQADHLYGAPGADLEIKGDVSVHLADTATVPGLAGYTVGLDDETFEAVTKELEETGSTDEKGHATLTVPIAPAGIGRPVEAKFDIAVAEAGGRQVERVVTVPILPAGPVIGVRPRFADGGLTAGAQAEFDVVSTLPDGKRRAVKGLKWELQSEERRWQWFMSEGRWSSQVVKVHRRVADGALDLGTGDPARLSVPVDWGSYRLELVTADGARTSFGFSVGWSGSATADSPDVLDVALDKTAYAAGDTMSVRLTPRFAGTATVAVVTDRVEAMKVADVDPAGTTVTLPVDRAWGASAHVVAIAHRPMDVKARRMPGRAVGVAWFQVEPKAHVLGVEIATEATMRPRGTLRVPLTVTGAEGKTARVVVAAVDVGILNLTHFETPNPDKWFFGQRQLPLDLRDLYGFLIDGMQGTRGKIETGGDGGAGDFTTPPREAPFSRYSGIVEVGPDGKAVVDFDVPAFNGTVRVMALAWTADKAGHADREVIVRDAVVIQPTVPRFLAFGDRTQFHFALDNVEGAAGDYRLTVEPQGGLVVPADRLSTTVKLAQKGRAAVTVPVTASTIGPASAAIRLTGPGVDAAQTVSFPVEPPTGEVYRRSVRQLPSGGSVEISDALLADYLPGTGAVSVAISPWSALDVPALLRALDRYPYGCSEQLVSRALPLLYVDRLATSSALALDDEAKARVDATIDRLLARQTSTGGFGLWSPASDDDVWLDAYVADFLTRARETGHAVPQKAFDQALDRLRNVITGEGEPTESNAAEVAYSLYVLARNGRPVMGDLRYLSDQKLDLFQTAAARSQLAAGLALLGDGTRAEPLFRTAVARITADEKARSWRSDYGSPLRDGVMTLALMAESRRPPSEWADVAAAIERLRDLRPQTSTQEQAWAVLAASAVADQAKGQKTTVSDGSVTQETSGPFFRTFRADALAGRPLKITAATTGEAAVPTRVVVTTSGNPVVQDGPASNGYTITRTIHTPDGKKADLAKIRQTDRLVVVLRIAEPKAENARIVVTDRLPAGFEIADPQLVAGGDTEAFAWLAEAPAASTTEFLDDRFVAAFDRSPDQSAFFEIAYAVRVVSPGRFVMPPAVVEDMYRPERFGRTGFATLDVAPRK